MPPHDVRDILRRVQELEEKQRETDAILGGERGDLGLMQKTGVMWRLWIVLICGIAGAVGVNWSNILKQLFKP